MKISYHFLGVTYYYYKKVWASFITLLKWERYSRTLEELETHTHKDNDNTVFLSLLFSRPLPLHHTLFLGEVVDATFSRGES